MSTEPISTHTRDEEEESTGQILDLTTNSRCTALYRFLRNGTDAVVLRKVNDTPPRYHFYWLNEHGTYCHDDVKNRTEAYNLVEAIRDSDRFVTYGRDATENIWPGPRYDKHPSPSKANVNRAQSGAGGEQ